MHQRRWLCALAMVPSLALCLAAQDVQPVQDSKPTPEAKSAKAGETIKVAEHHSRWDYPKEITPAEGQQVHVVERGDTLWDLGGKYLGNPFSWPQIWELNKWVKEPHWIYPGDPLLVEAGRSVVGKPEVPAKPGEVPASGTPAASGVLPESADLATEEVADLVPDRQTGRTPLRVYRDELAFSFQDFIQMPYLVSKGAQAHFKEIGAVTIVGQRNEDRQHLGDGEEIYIRGGLDRGLKIGDRMVILKLVQPSLFHPDDRRLQTPLGDVVQQVGVLRILHVNPKGSTAIIEHAMDTVEIGDHAAPFQEPANIVLKLRTDTKDPVVVKDPGKIVFARDNHHQTADSEMVIVDRGLADGLKLGDVLLAAKEQVYPVNDPQNPRDHAMEVTHCYKGQVLVVKVGEHSATCRVLRAKEELSLGDLLTR